MGKFMTSFGVPIVSIMEGDGTMEDLQESIGKKLSEIDVNKFPSLRDSSQLKTAQPDGKAS